MTATLNTYSLWHCYNRKCNSIYLFIGMQS